MARRAAPRAGRPATPFVAGFVGAANVLSGTMEAGHVRIDGGWPAGATGIEHLSAGSKVHAYVRPHDIGVMVGPSRPGACPATVERVTNLGYASKVRLRLAEGQGLTADVANEDLPPVAEGDAVHVDLRNATVFEAEDRSGHFAGIEQDDLAVPASVA